MEPDVHKFPPSTPNPASGHDSDPDAVDLPPGAILPDAKTFRRDQLWSWVVSNAVGLVLLLGMWALATDHPKLILICAAVLGVSLVLNVILLGHGRGGSAAARGPVGWVERLAKPTIRLPIGFTFKPATNIGMSD